MKHYGYRRVNSLIETGEEWAICPTDFKRMWAGGKIPPPLSRRQLGIMTITSKAQAKTLFCHVCRKPLVVC